ncbi:MAG: hypothetical protein MZV64_29765 [Ignavibacteriales bacterium]|nr:hypothetical protein [Ignavibacteriales bacterium]
MPTVGVVDGARTIIFVGLPLHLLNNTVSGNPLGLTPFFTRASPRSSTWPGRQSGEILT